MKTRISVLLADDAEGTAALVAFHLYEDGFVTSETVAMFHRLKTAIYVNTKRRRSQS